MIKDYNGNNPTNANATQTSNGLMSADDKTKLDNLGLSVDTLPIGSEVLIDSDKDIPEGWEEVEEVYSNPNMLINGDFQIWQRNDRSTDEIQIYVNAGKTYTADRWYINSNSIVELTVMRSEKGPGLMNVSDGGTWVYPTQTLENRLNDTKYTLSCSINNIQQDILVITGGTSSSNSRIEYKVGTSYDEIIISLKSGETLNWVKLELGEICTPFIPKSYSEELLNCYRYYYKIKKNGYMLGSCVNTNSMYLPVTFPVEMRISNPTLYLSGCQVHVCNNTGGELGKSITKYFYSKSNSSMDKTVLISVWHDAASGYISKMLDMLASGYLSFDAEIY